ncbi:protein arginine N-methyltransferase [Paramagnetospirillum marisnigri]|uniref:protein arginine N-methyltransferase n=1 Tax=Paramagnetospirillum marisnigri TaxID=1285242 RepID=UPI0009EF0E65|nr:protein arginine N-methyltransferase [Paramagnetospirillum marisnigri]
MTEDDIQRLMDMVDSGDAAAVLAECQRDTTKDWVRLYVQGVALATLGRRQEALESVREAIHQNPSDRRPWWTAMHLMQGEASHADFIEFLPSYLERFPGDLQVRNFIGSVFSKEERWAEAQREFNQAIAFDPRQSLAHFGKVVALIGEGRFEDASRALEDGKAMRPRFDAQAAVRLNSEGLALAELGRWSEAAAKFRAAVAAHIEADEAHYNLGVALKQMGAVDFFPFAPLNPMFRRLRDLFYAMSYYENQDPSWRSLNSMWQGRIMQKFPADMMTYHRILWETKPTLIVECGTFDGGSALYYASLFDMVGEGRVVSVDIIHKDGLPHHPRVEYITGSSIAPEIVRRVRNAVRPGDRVMVVLDSNHDRDHVEAELAAYHDLVTSGCYLVVEDSSIDLCPVANTHYQNGGPLYAIADFIGQHPEYVIDRRREQYLTTVAPYGFLYRIPPIPDRGTASAES